MNTYEIFNSIPVNDHLVTGGQPTAEQLRSAAADGFTAVINLADARASRTLEGEAELVRSLGMTYFHIPVDWENPLPGDFAAFERTMRFVANAKTVLHCSANYRVTAFYSLYAQKYLGWTESQASEFRARIWNVSDYPAWESFLAQMRASFLVQNDHLKKETNPMDETSTNVPVPEMIETIALEQPVNPDAESAPPDDKTIQDTLALGISAGHDAKIEDSLILGGVAAGNNVTVSDSGAAAFVAGADLQMEDAGALVAVVGGDMHVKSGGIGILVAGGDVNLEEGSQILMTSQHALIIGAVSGAVFALFNLIFRLLRKK